MGVSKKEFRNSLTDLTEDKYYIEKKGTKLMVWFYDEEDCRKLAMLPYDIKEINKLGEFPAKYLVSKRISNKRQHGCDTQYGRARCMDWSSMMIDTEE